MALVASDDDRQALQWIDRERRVEPASDESFDRIGFAMRALRRVRPQMPVAVYEGSSTLRVDAVRDFRGERRWAFAVVAIPPHASREHIAYAIAELAGVADVPYLVRTLMADDLDASS